jgi:hypothetical protein
MQTKACATPNVAAYFVVSGFPSPATAGVSGTVTVTAYDAYGNVATGYTGTVQFTSSDGQAVLPADSTLSSGTGTFSVTLVTVGSQSINVTDTVNSSINGSLAVTVDPNVATQLVVTSSSGVQTAGVPFTILVRAVDAYGNTATSYLGTVVFTTSDVGFGVNLPTSYTFTAEAAGEASFSAVLVTAGSQSINVTDTVNSSINGSLAVTVVANVATHLVVTSSGGTETAGVPFTILVRAVNAYGGTATSYVGTVDFTTSDSGVHVYLPTPYTFTAENAGEASFSAVLVTVGSQSINVTDTVNSSINGSLAVTVVANVATHLVVTSSGGTETAGVPFTILVRAVNAYGGTATSYVGTVVFTTSDLGFGVNLPSPYTFTAEDAGEASFSVTLVTASSDASITVFDGTLTASDTGITVVHGSAVSVMVSPASDSITAGSSDTFTALATDAYGNSWDDTGLVAWSINTASGTFTANSVMVTGAGSWTITATDPDSVYGTASLTVTPAGLDQFVFSTVGTQTAGSFSITITAEDQYGNTATSYTGTPSLSDLSGTISPTSTSAFVGGVWTGSVTVTLAGSDSITATDGAITGTSNTFTVTHSSVVSIAVSPVTQTISAGASQTYSATAADLFGNTWDVTGLVTWSIDSGAGGSWSGATYTSANAGSWTVKATLGEVYGTASLTVNIYQITVISAHGNPTASASVNEGGSFTASVTSPESAGVGQQWICTGYSIDGGSIFSGTSYTFIDIQANYTITFNWQEQYYLTTSTNFGSVLPVSGWYDAGSTVTLSATAPSAGLSEQYVWNGWTGTGTGSYSGNDLPAVNEVTINGPITETASWTHQYQVTASYSTSDGTSPTANVVLSGTSLGSPSYTTLTTSPQQVWLDAGSSWSVNSPIIAGSGTEQWIATAGTSGTIGSATMVDPSYDHQCYLTVTSAYGTASGSGWYSAGSTAYAGLSTGTVSGGAGTQYVFTSWDTDASGTNYVQSNAITMNSPMTATANWQTQYQLTFAVSGSGSTIPTGSNVWENAGSLSITATPDTGYTFTYWSSSSGSITFNNDNSASATATIDGTGTITATFAITTSPTPIVSSPSPTPIVSSPSPTPIVSSPSPTPIVTSPSPTPKGSSPSPTPLYVVLVAVIIVAAIILISIGIALKRSRRKTNIALSN